ncbi:MAG: hypothetical protein IAE80_29735 [Anaerolinea sp.]|nr:hypothetical protein [Anaerolinea sp.]
MSSDILVKLDDRVRLMSGLLAATRYPEVSQQKKPHGTHAHARATKKLVAPYVNHPAALALQLLLDQNAPLEAIFSLALVLRPADFGIDKPPRWMPPAWNDQLGDFQNATQIAAWWAHEDAAWNKALTDTETILNTMRLKALFEPYVGEVKERLVFIPNICYPTDQEVSFRIGGDLVAIVPPRLAWGDSPPWPFAEDAGHLYRAAINAYGRLLMSAYLRANPEKLTEVEKSPLPVTDAMKAAYPTWAEQFTELFVKGAVAIYLEDHVNQAEANAFVLMERKVSGLDKLPGVISVLRRYLSELEAGRYTNLLDFLPSFPRHLRVANRIVTL